MDDLAETWYKLDNSAKIYPLMTGKKHQNLFRVSVDLKEKVNPEILSKAINNTIRHFPSFSVKLMRGIFWYYFEHVKEEVKIYPQDNYMFHKIDSSSKNPFCFKCLYDNNRISLIIYHVITDAYGAFEFLKSILYEYMNLKGVLFSDKKNILLPGRNSIKEEIRDGFLEFYKHEKLRDLKIDSLKGNKAYKIKGEQIKEKDVNFVELLIPVDKLKEASKKNNSTITEFLAANIILSILNSNKDISSSIEMFIPINLRNIFHFNTLRNFSLFSRVSTRQIKNLNCFNQILKEVQKSLKNDISKDLLVKKISTTVRAEKFLPLKIMPLFIKKAIFKISNLFFGKNKKTLSFSNFGIVNVPYEMKKYIDNFSFNIFASKSHPFSASAVSTGNILSFALTSIYKDNNILREFVNLLSLYDINVTVKTNMEDKFEKM